MESSSKKLVSIKLSPKTHKLKFCKLSGDKLIVSHSGSKKKAHVLIEPTKDTDDFNDIKEILSLISPRELSKPHHEATAALLHETKSINYLSQGYLDSENNSGCRTPEMNYLKHKEFIIRKHPPVRTKTRK